jgi:ureidoglycolate hydrolase
MTNDPYLEITEFSGEGYHPCVDFGEWRVAILRFIADLKAENITYLERHLETDEVFVLLEGGCTLIIGKGSSKINQLRVVEMVSNKIYNIKKGTYHNHILSQDAVVLIVENKDTGAENSDRTTLSQTLRKQILSLA